MNMTALVRRLAVPALILTLTGCFSVPPLPDPDARVQCDRIITRIVSHTADTDEQTPPPEAEKFDVASGSIDDLVERIGRRYRRLDKALSAGQVGFGADGYLALRDEADALPFDEQNRLRNLTANQNADLAALYRAIATLNDEPRWETGVRELFAQRWAERAPSGTWVQSRSGDWQQH